MNQANDIEPDELPGSPESSPPQLDDHRLESIRAILLAQDREQINALAAETAALENKSQQEKEALLQRIEALQQELDRLQESNRRGQELADRLQEELDHIRLDMAADHENRVPFLVGRISDVLSQAAKESRLSLARALSPVMGAAISSQIRESQDEMIDALQPIILRTVQKALAQFGRDLQRNIDARLKASLGPAGLFRSFTSRLRGVDDADLILRESLPFTIDELFLIQRESGLLVDYAGAEQDEGREKELISGMLTAVRDFTRDSFGDGTTEEELDEIQYGDERIIIEGGTAAYVAAAVQGVEPPGFRTALSDFIAEQHLYYGEELRNFDGDLDGLPDFNAELNDFRERFAPTAPAPVEPMSSRERRLLIAAGIGGILALALACFYLQFTIALLPVAFGETATPTSTMMPTNTVTVTVTETAVPTITPTVTSTNTPTSTHTAVPSATATESPSPSPTPRPSATPTIVPPTATRELTRAIAPVWARRTPDQDSDLLFTIPAAVDITILDRSGEWLEVEVVTGDDRQQGWVHQRWVEIP